MKQIEKFFQASNLIENVHDSEENNDAVVYFNLKYDYKKYHKYMGHLNDYCIPGEFRDYDVFVGGRKGLNPLAIEASLESLFEWEPETWKQIVKWHIHYEHIHPFGDGNGRTGRYIMAQQCKKAGCLRQMYDFFNRGAFDKMRREYYSWF